MLMKLIVRFLSGIKPLDLDHLSWFFGGFQQSARKFVIRLGFTEAMIPSLVITLTSKSICYNSYPPSFEALGYLGALICNFSLRLISLFEALQSQFESLAGSHGTSSYSNIDNVGL